MTVGACMVGKVLITAVVSCARFQDSLVNFNDCYSHGRTAESNPGSFIHEPMTAGTPEHHKLNGWVSNKQLAAVPD